MSHAHEPDYPAPPAPGLVHAGSLAALAKAGRQLVKIDGKQIVLFHGEKGVFACNNRCPHEGYPLKEGSLADGCILTCNWHNWKFDLESGETLVGGDSLRRYPVTIAEGEIWLDVTDPPPEARAADALRNLRDSFRRHEYDRMAREIARLGNTGADPLEALRQAIVWTHDRFEFGTTHAHAASPDWLWLGETMARDEGEALVPLLECVGYLAWDSLREPVFPYPDGVATFDAEKLVAAIENEDEALAQSLARGALREGLGWAALERPLAAAALAHYQDFGHAAIYVYKTGQLIERLGPGVAEPLVLLLVRSLIFASREDLIPEFRHYATALAAWDGAGSEPVAGEDFVGLDVPRALDRCVASSGDPQTLYHALLAVGAWNFLHVDLSYQDRTSGPVSQNVGWLDFTHHITFANAVRVLCERHPELWPQGLLQMACFAGRNTGYTDKTIREADWAVLEPLTFLDTRLAGLFDHAQAEYIVSVHLVKLLTAVREEVETAPDAAWVPSLLAAVNRFLNSPLKRKHATRTARQAIAFTRLEG